MLLCGLAYRSSLADATLVHASVGYPSSTLPHRVPRCRHEALSVARRCGTTSSSCMTNKNSSTNSNSNSANPSINGTDEPTRLRQRQYGVLQSAFSTEDRIGDSNWLTSTFIDIVLYRLAMQYTEVHFMPTEFCHFHLASITRRPRATLGKRKTKRAKLAAPLLAPTDFLLRDVLGRRVDYPSTRDIVFVANVSLIHWNLFRVQFTPHNELQLFEPMGRLSSRAGAISTRSVPRSVTEWLDVCFPESSSWRPRTVSAITRQHQLSGFDCGVACLLYADKCGRGESRQQINDTTDQREITAFRQQLQVLHSSGRLWDDAPGSPGPGIAVG